MPAQRCCRGSLPEVHLAHAARNLHGTILKFESVHDVQTTAATFDDSCITVHGNMQSHGRMQLLWVHGNANNGETSLSTR